MILSDRTALVTGASRGIGAAISRAMDGAGIRVALVAKHGDALSALRNTLGAGHLEVACDLTQPDAVRELAASVINWASGPPDIIVNNAGVFPFSPIHEQDSVQFVHTLALGVTAPFLVLRCFLPAMRARGSGDVVTIGSISDRHTYSGNGAYNAAKYGARALHEVLRAETRGSGIRATLVSPGPVSTEIWNPHEDLLGGTLPPRSEMLSAEDVARAVMFVLSEPQGVTMEELRLSRS